MKGDVKVFREKGKSHDSRQRCGKLTLTAQHEMDAALLAMLARVLFYSEGTKGFTRANLYQTLACEMKDFDNPLFKDAVAVSAHEIAKGPNRKFKGPKP